MARPVPLVFALILPFVLAAAALAAPEVVRNGSTPAHGTERLELVEQWRLGGADDEENFFGLVTWAELGPDGLLYVLDAQLCQVHAYDRDGVLVKTLFRQGDGPGEVRQPRDLVLLPNGDVGVVQEFPGKIIAVDAAGDPAATITPGTGDPAAGNLMALTSAEHRGGTFMVAGVSLRLGEREGTQIRRNYLATLDDDGIVRDYLVESHVDWDFANFTYDENKALPSFFWAHAVGPDGRIYVAADRDAYRISVFTPDGAHVRDIERDYESWRRTAAETRWLRTLLEGAFRNLPGELNLVLSGHEPDIAWLNRGVQVAENGELWILPSRGTREQPAGVLATFDVFDTAGRFERQVSLVCPEGDGAEDGIFLLGDDRVLLIKGYVDATATMFGGAVDEDDGEAAPMELVCFRIVR